MVWRKRCSFPWDDMIISLILISLILLAFLFGEPVFDRFWELLCLYFRFQIWNSYQFVEFCNQNSLKVYCPVSFLPLSKKSLHYHVMFLSGAFCVATSKKYHWQKLAGKKLLAKLTSRYGWQKKPLANIYWQKNTLANIYWQIYTSIFLTGILVLANIPLARKY